MNLKLLTYVNKLYSKIDLGDFSLVACQHYFETNQKMIFSLMEKGLKAKNVFMIPKSYSYNEEINKRFLKKGIFSFNYAFNSHKSFDSQFKKQINLFLKKIKHKLNKKILVIDDGGELIKKFRLIKNKEIYAVEQTSSGFSKLKKTNISFPVLNVARSKAKLELESPFIADLVYSNTLKEIKKEKFVPKNVLIFGKGPIGKEVGERFSKKFKVSYLDIAEEKINKKVLLGKKNLLVVGCTGEKSINKKDYKYFKGKTFLVSASSSDREFDSSFIRKRIPLNNNPHKNIKFKNINLINSGFPITFKGTIHGSPPEKIQLTQSLMLAGAYESVKSLKKGLIPLDENIQNKIINLFKKI
jgi:S-adenosylhomocysteine hydrolase